MENNSNNASQPSLPSTPPTDTINPQKSYNIDQAHHNEITVSVSEPGQDLQVNPESNNLLRSYVYYLSLFFILFLNVRVLGTIFAPLADWHPKRLRKQVSEMQLGLLFANAFALTVINAIIIGLIFWLVIYELRNGNYKKEQLYQDPIFVALILPGIACYLWGSYLAWASHEGNNIRKRAIGFAITFIGIVVILIAVTATNR